MVNLFLSSSNKAVTVKTEDDEIQRAPFSFSSNPRSARLSDAERSIASPGRSDNRPQARSSLYTTNLIMQTIILVDVVYTSAQTIPAVRMHPSSAADSGSN